jgi:ADP-heptose:LPS heptosyltransferase
MWLAGARHRVGWVCGGGGFLLTQAVPYIPQRPEMLSRIMLAQAAGAQVEPALIGRRGWFRIGYEARRRAREVLAELRVVSRPLVVFHVGAGTAAKEWPVESWRELVGRAIVELGATVVLIGGQRDRYRAAQILEYRNWPGVADATGRLALVETAALLENCDAFVGCDSGPAHLAAAVDAPAIVLFSGTNHLDQWRPWGRRVSVLRHAVACSPCHSETCPLAAHPCMKGLNAQQVAQRLALLVRRREADCGLLPSSAGGPESDDGEPAVPTHGFVM